MKGHASALAGDDVDIDEAVVLLHDLATEIGFQASRQYCQALYVDARELPEPLRGGWYSEDDLRMHPEPDLWGKLFMSESWNLVAAPPKVGKTSLVLHLAACVFRGDLECLGKPIYSRFDHLVILGTDMPEHIWLSMLIREGLASRETRTVHGIDKSGISIDKRVTLWPRGSEVNLSPKGISTMVGECAKHDHSLLLIDTYRSNVTDLGLDEKSSRLAEPLYAAQKAFAYAGTTVTAIVNHHTGKDVKGGSAATASSGSNALPGACDNTVLLNWLKPGLDGVEREDRRLVISSEGRNGSDSVVAEIVDGEDGPLWKAHGDAGLHRALEAFWERLEGLSGRQEESYDLAANYAEQGRTISSEELAAHLNLTKPKALRALKALERRGLLRVVQAPGGYLTGGRPPLLYSAVTEKDLELGVKYQKHVDNELTGKETFDRPTVEIGTVVERLMGNTWKQGYVVVDGADLHSIKVSKIGTPMVTYSSLRWELDVREATGSPFANPPQQDQSTNQLPWE